jgi:gliding motility-associated-like protein
VTITSDATYILTVFGFNGCFNTDTINIIRRLDLGIFAGPDTTVVRGQEVTLTASGGDFSSYEWTPVTGLTSPDQPVTIAAPERSTNYIVTGISEFGCPERDTIAIFIAENVLVYDVFSPNNGDDLNNYFEIGNAYLYPEIKVEIFTRWGEKLFSSEGYSDEQRWDGTFKGKDVPIGTYYFIIIPYPGAEAISGPLTIVR